MWGEILVGPSVRLPFEGPAVRSRRWGVADWWSASGEVVRSWSAAAGRDGTVVPSLPAEAHVRFDDHGLPVAGDSPVLGVAPVLVTGPDGRRARLARAVCRNGDTYGWAEWLRQP
jgi:hypothetical protein